MTSFLVLPPHVPDLAKAILQRQSGKHIDQQIDRFCYRTYSLPQWQEEMWRSYGFAYPWDHAPPYTTEMRCAINLYKRFGLTFRMSMEDEREVDETYRVVPVHADLGLGEPTYGYTMISTLLAAFLCFFSEGSRKEFLYEETDAEFKTWTSRREQLLQAMLQNPEKFRS